MSRSTILALAIGVTLVAVPAAIAASFPLKLLNALTSRKGYTIEADVAYGALSRQRLDLYVPHDIGPQTPVVVFFYGGGWNRGERADYGRVNHIAMGNSMADERGRISRREWISALEFRRLPVRFHRDDRDRRRWPRGCEWRGWDRAMVSTSNLNEQVQCLDIRPIHLRILTKFLKFPLRLKDRPLVFRHKFDVMI